jgi:hypothetical protein
VYDLSGETATFPNTETVSYFHRLTGTTDTAGSVCRNASDFAERALSDGEYIRESQMWLIPLASLTLDPTSGDTIVDGSGVAHVVLKVGGGFSGSAWRVSTRRAKIWGYYNTIDWYRISQTTNDYGDRLASLANFTLMAAAVPARIQPATPDVLDILGKRGLLNHYAVWVLPDWDLTYGDILVDTKNGNAQYKVVGWKNKEELAEALLILATKQP